MLIPCTTPITVTKPLVTPPPSFTANPFSFLSTGAHFNVRNTYTSHINRIQPNQQHHPPPFHDSQVPHNHITLLQAPHRPLPQPVTLLHTNHPQQRHLILPHLLNHPYNHRLLQHHNPLHRSLTQLRLQLLTTILPKHPHDSTKSLHGQAARLPS